MCGTRPSGHWASKRLRRSRQAREGLTNPRPIAMNAVSQLHWWGYRLREGTMWSPAQLLSRTRAAEFQSSADISVTLFLAFPAAVAGRPPSSAAGGPAEENLWGAVGDRTIGASPAHHLAS